MYLALIILPLLGSLIAGFFGRKVGTSGSELITNFCVILTMILSLLTFFEVGLNNVPVFLELFKWIDSESLSVFWGFNFDAVTVSMLIPVLIVSSLVHVYSIGYMSHDPHRQRFFSYLSLFTFMMIILVTANNFLLMFVGWEGVGICSYLLVNFWFTRIAANQSSVSALLTNRVGDCFLTIGMFTILWTFGNLDYATVFSLVPFSSEVIVTIIGVCLLIGAMAKSSQIGLHVWLPMAMEGPTPVSALIHAATMVTAGVYLLIRCSPLIEYSSLVLLLCLWVGAITTILSSLIGLFQQDIKKVIAYSTMSQLGMMVIAIGLSSYQIAIFHLVNHAFYKALLFLAAGGVIHAVSDNQDFRKYGGLRHSLPLSYSVMLIASLSLMAIPFMTGFYSKDLILESSYGGFNFSDIAVYFIATIGAIFTSLYSVKVLYLTFLANPSGSLKDYNESHEGDIFMSLPLIILAIFSIFFGFIVKEIFIGLGTNFFSDNSIFIHPLHELMLNTEFAVPTLFKLLPLIFTLLVIPSSLLILEFFPKLLIHFKSTRIGYNLFSLFSQRLYLESFYNKYITDIVLKLGGQTTKVLDKGSIELNGPYGLEKGLTFLSSNIAKLDTGVITSYALYILIGLMFYILIPSLALTSLLLIILLGLLSLSQGSVELANNNKIRPGLINISPKDSGALSKLGVLLIFVSALIIILIEEYIDLNELFHCLCNTLYVQEVVDSIQKMIESMQKPLFMASNGNGDANWQGGFYHGSTGNISSGIMESVEPADPVIPDDSGSQATNGIGHNTNGTSHNTTVTSQDANVAGQDTNVAVQNVNGVAQNVNGDSTHIHQNIVQTSIPQDAVPTSVETPTTEAPSESADPDLARDIRFSLARVADTLQELNSGQPETTSTEKYADAAERCAHEKDYINVSKHNMVQEFSDPRADQEMQGIQTQVNRIHSDINTIERTPVNSPEEATEKAEKIREMTSVVDLTEDIMHDLNFIE